MDRRGFLRNALGTAGGLWAWGSGGCQSTLSSMPSLLPGKIKRREGRAGMNILFIHNQALTTRAVGCYGNERVKTPHIDRLALQGIRFTRAYCAAPMDHPSCASICTGLRPDSTRIYTDRDRMDERTPTWAKGMGHILLERGAYQVNIGTLYHGPEANKDYHAFHQLDYCPRPEGYMGKSLVRGNQDCDKRRFEYAADPAIEAELKRRAQAGQPTLDLQYQLIGDSGRPESCEEETHKAGLAGEVMQRCKREGRQFFLSLGFNKPDLPLLAPQSYVDLYDPATMDLPLSREDLDKNMPPAAKRFGTKPGLFSGDFDEAFPQLRETPEREKQAIAAYYAATTFIDAQLGALLDALEKTGLIDETIVVLCADQGFHLGEHGLWGKYTQFEEVMRVPLIVHVPGAAGNGKVCDEIVELVDLLPSLCDLWAIEKPAYFEGISFLPLLENPQRPLKKAAYNVFNMRDVCDRNVTARSVRTKNYRYTEWGENGRFGIELYDLVDDPLEQVNQAYHRKFGELRGRLAKALQLGWQAALSESV